MRQASQAAEAAQRGALAAHCRAEAAGDRAAELKQGIRGSKHERDAAAARAALAARAAQAHERAGKAAENHGDPEHAAEHRRAAAEARSAALEDREAGQSGSG